MSDSFATLPGTVAHQAPSIHRISRARILECTDMPTPFQGIFLTQGSNPGLLHCRQILYLLSHHLLFNIVLPQSRVNDGTSADLHHDGLPVPPPPCGSAHGIASSCPGTCTQPHWRPEENSSPWTKAGAWAVKKLS